jgi:hypothetical protein
MGIEISPTKYLFILSPIKKMNEETIVKVNSDEVAISTPTITTINVEEVKARMDMIEASHQQDINNHNIQMAELQSQLDKAAEAGVTPDGVDGEVVVEPIAEEKQMEENLNPSEEIIAPIEDTVVEPVIEDVIETPTEVVI